MKDAKQTCGGAWHCSCKFVMTWMVAASFAGVSLAQSVTAAAPPAFLKIRPPDPNHSVSLPVGVNRLGFTVDVRVSESELTEPMRIEIDFATTAGPTTADRNLTVTLLPSPGGHAPPTSAIEVQCPFRVPQGTKFLRVVRHVPKTSYGDAYQVVVSEGGRPLDQFRSSLGAMIRNPYEAPRNAVMHSTKWSVLWVDCDVDSAERTAAIRQTLLPLTSNLLTVSEIDQMAAAGDFSDWWGALASRSPNQLPLDWRGYASFDAVVIHRSQWQTWSTEDSPTAIALRQWIQTGGQLIIRDAEPSRVASSHTLDQLVLAVHRELVATAKEIGKDADSAESLLDGKFPTSPTVIVEGRTNEGPLTRSVRALVGVEPTDATNPPMDAGQRTVYETGLKQVREAERSLDTMLAKPIDATSNTVRVSSMLAGQIVWISKQSPDAEPITALQWIVAERARGWRNSSLLRSGVDPILGSSRFFQWVIPGVAQPPVYTFMGLLSVFVVLVGPVAYRKTMRTGRGYLMFAVAPILAIVTTAALLGYGVVSDGFGTQARIRQITWVDGQTGDAATRTRQTYFAGIRPSRGLTFPPNADVTIYPDNESRPWEDRINDRFQTRGRAIVTDDATRLSGEFLPSRQQRQFVVHQPRPSWGSLRVETSEAAPRAPVPINPNDASEPPQGTILQVAVTSSMKTPLTDVVVRVSTGQHYQVDSLPAGGSATASWLAPMEASKQLGEIYKREWLISSVVDRRRTSTNYRNYYGDETLDLLVEAQTFFPGNEKPVEGLFETELQNRLQLGGGLPVNSFVAVAGLTDDALAIPGAAVKASIHFVMGDLR